MNRVGERARAKASGWAGSCMRRWRVSSAMRSGATTRAGGALAVDMMRCAKRWKNGLGRRLVSPGLFRRRLRPGFGLQPRVPDRSHRPVLGGDFRRRVAGAGRARHGGGGQISGAAGGRADDCCSPRLSSAAARSRLHQGLSRRHPREWRPIYPWRHVGGHRLRPAGRWRPAGELFAMLNPVNHVAIGPSRSATGWSPMSPAPMSIRCRRMSGAVAGPGTPAPPPGCIAWRWNTYSVCALSAAGFSSSRSFPRTGPASK